MGSGHARSLVSLDSDAKLVAGSNPAANGGMESEGSPYHKKTPASCWGSCLALYYSSTVYRDSVLGFCESRSVTETSSSTGLSRDNIQRGWRKLDPLCPFPKIRDQGITLIHLPYMPYIPPKGTSLAKRRAWYRNVYLKSDHWKQFRQTVLINSGRLCVNCSSRTRLQVHHLTYDRLYKELISDMMVLCYNCHKKADKIKFGGAVDRRRKMTLKWLKFNGTVSQFLRSIN